VSQYCNIGLVLIGLVLNPEDQVIEAEVHQQLRAFLREQGESYWAHHLTMARLVARALRVGRSALIQTGTHEGHYRLSYLVPLLMWPEPVVLVAPAALHQRLLQVEIPRLWQWISRSKPIHVSDRFPSPDYRGIVLTTPAAWLGDRLHNEGRFPTQTPTIIDSVDELERWTYRHLTAKLQPGDWEALMLAFPQQRETIRDSRVALTKAIYDHPVNPYECYLLAAEERSILLQLARHLVNDPQTALATQPWQLFFHQLQNPQNLAWVSVMRSQGQFELGVTPAVVATALAPVWQQQPTVLIGEALDLETEANLYRQRLGLGELTCLKFNPDRQEALIHLYQPEGIPLPNTPDYQHKMMGELRSLISVNTTGFSVILLQDLPLKAQLAASLASEYGSRVQVERTCLDDNGILVSGWDFWRKHQALLPIPQLLVIPTLPIPSLEHPLVAGRVAYYKQQRQDWFRLYLFPEALSTLQRAIAPVRASQGVVALLDSRVMFRSYGDQVLSALSPFARLNHFDSDLFAQLYPD
jgi:ATP-dependent DNA helicase DinG